MQDVFGKKEGGELFFVGGTSFFCLGGLVLFFVECKKLYLMNLREFYLKFDVLIMEVACFKF